MLVYGDATRTQEPRAVLEMLRARAASLGTPSPWIERHARLVDLFIRASELAQGLVDQEFERTGLDRLSMRQSASAGALRSLARAVLWSWGAAWQGAEADVAAAIDRLAEIDAPDPVPIRTAEGYAFYALYPEAYGAAASVLRGTFPVVLGLRSIGIGLGAMVAAGSDAAWSYSVRPVGHPFRRELAVGEDVLAAWRGHRDGVFAIADEGPGLSGSSLAAAARALEDVGAARGRIHFFPSHRNLPGTAAAPEIVERWGAAPRHCVRFDDMVLGATAPRHRLASWVKDLTGAPVAPMREISGGAWRELKRYAEPPPVHAQQERRKFLLESARGHFVLRFAGLGPYGEATLRRARALAEAGFTPPVLGLRHGFLVERWLDEGEPLDLTERSGLVARLADYLAFRARRFPADAGSGASLAQLARMRARNLSHTTGREIDVAEPGERARDLEARVRRVETDNRMQPWEWLRMPDGRIIKTDACDHCAAHDLVGCQDIAWDVAGARIELRLADDEFARLGRELANRDVRLDPSLLAFYTPCYRAFRIGSLALAAEAAAEHEKRPIEAAIKYYLSGLI